jgi:hypothetical protein
MSSKDPVEEVKNLLQQRTNKRRTFTTAANKIKDIVTKVTPTAIDLEMVQTVLAVLEKHLVELERLNSKIEVLLLDISDEQAQEDAEKALDRLLEDQGKITRAQNFLKKIAIYGDNFGA